MKSISIRFNNDLANWITECAQKVRINKSKFIKDLLIEKAQQGSITLRHSKNPINGIINKHSKSKMGYVVFTSKLLERLVLITQEQGESLRNLAFEETGDLLNQLNFNDQEQRFCIRLEEQLFTWLNNEASRLQLKIVPLIRRLIEDSFIQSNSIIEHEFTDLRLQKLATQHQINACKLLEKLVYKSIENAPAVIEEIRIKTEAILLKLFPEPVVIN